MSAFHFLAYFSNFLINSLIFFTFVMVAGGFVYTRRRRRRRSEPTVSPSEYPMLSVIVPARNEENVIRATVLSLLDQDYPEDRYEIMVVNDNSTDHTGDILRELQEEFPKRRLRVLTTDEKTGGKGKSSVLNLAVEECQGSVIAVYDADNTPEKGALRLLVCALIQDDKIAAVAGKFRTRNRNESFLTRLIDQETLMAQAISQAGFWAYFKASILPGTNFVIRRSVIEEVGGWHLKALTEDMEISMRILATGKLIRYIPEAVTWEQEPSRFRPWLRQRTRWARGNLSLVIKNIPNLFRRNSFRMKVVEGFMLATYFVLFFGVIVSDVVLIGNAFNLFHIPTWGVAVGLVFRFSWGTQILLYFLNVILAIWQEPEERTIISVLLIPILLFGYSKLWIVVIANAVIKMIGDAIHRREAAWDKTVHVAETISPESARQGKK